MATTDGSRLYDLVALALAAYARSRFRIRVLGAPFHLRERTLLVSSHRSDDDVPLLVAALYRQAHGLLRRGPRLHFAVRDDLFVPGFLAGYPPWMPRVLRRLLYGLDVGPILRGRLPCHPVRSATTMRLVELLREHPDAPLDELVPPPLRAPLHARAASLGRTPWLAGDVLGGEYADLLWAPVEADGAGGERAAASWRARRAAAMEDFRELVGVVDRGGALLFFPEGRPSPDGALGPVLGGVAGLVRRARPRALVPVAPAYDPLVDGRVRAYVGVGPPVEPPSRAEDVLALLRRTTPLTVGDSLAAALADGADPEARLAQDVASARAQDRPYEPELDDPEVRRERLALARRLAAGRSLRRLELAYRSARA